MSGQRAAHRIAVDMRLRDLQMIHQLDDVLRAARSVRLGLVALAVIAIVEGDDAVGFRERRRDAGREPHSLRGVCVAVHEHHPRTAPAHRQVMNLDAVGRLEERGFLREQRRGREQGDQEQNGSHAAS